MLDGARFQFWDLGGQSSLRRLWRDYFSAAHMILFVIDSGTPARLQESCSVLRDMADSGELDDLPILILANKQDGEHALPVEAIKSEVMPLIERIDPKEGGVLPCSAITGAGVDAALAWISSRVSRNKGARPPVLR